MNFARNEDQAEILPSSNEAHQNRYIHIPFLIAKNEIKVLLLEAKIRTNIREIYLFSNLIASKCKYNF
jgi:hypothetical protein